jgi:hypothetical protein
MQIGLGRMITPGDELLGRAVRQTALVPAGTRPAPIYQAMLPHMSALPLILSDKRASHGSSCLGKSTEKQRLWYGSEHMIPAADAYPIDASNSQQRPPWGCPEVAGLP